MTIYCIVPADLADALHPTLRELYRHDPGVEVVVERRAGERRRSADRREPSSNPAETPVERRSIRSREGRRAGERRALPTPVRPPSLPRKLSRFASQLSFVELVQPSSLRTEDLETDRVIARFQAGDIDAFGELYLRYFDRVFSYTLVAVRSPHEAEDVTQQIFTRIFEALPRYEIRHEKAFRAWLFTIARNQVISHLQKYNRVQPMETERIERRRLEDVGDDATLRWTLHWLSDSELLMFLERLPLVQRQVLMLRFLAGLTTAEIAAILERSPESVRQLQRRALRFLSDRLVAIGRKPVETGRHPTLTVLRQVPVLRARRFALGNPS